MNEIVVPLESERVIINSPMSFAGAFQRTMRLRGHREGWVKWLVLAAVVSLLVLWEATVVAWYCVLGPLWLIVFPYRVLRRGVRKRKAEALRHRELLAAVHHNHDG